MKGVVRTGGGRGGGVGKNKNWETGETLFGVLFHYLKTWFLTWNQINRSRFTSPRNLTSNPYFTVVNHCCKGLHITCEFLLDLLMIKNSGNNLKHSWRLNFFTYITTRAFNSCFNSPLRYPIYDRCLGEFSYNLAKLFKIIWGNIKNNKLTDRKKKIE